MKAFLPLSFLRDTSWPWWLRLLPVAWRKCTTAGTKGAIDGKHAERQTEM
jgi:hypothetical protein